MRTLFFAVADLLVNASAGALIGLVVWRLVGTPTPMLLGMVIGMGVGMALGLIGSLLLMPLLGGHEVMIPVMLTGMLAGMTVGMGVSMSGVEAAGAVELGGAVGFAVSAVCTAWSLLLRRPFVPPAAVGDVSAGEH